MHPQVYGALGGTTITVGLGDILFRGVHVTGFWCAHLPLTVRPAVCFTQIQTLPQQAAAPRESNLDVCASCCGSS